MRCYGYSYAFNQNNIDRRGIMTLLLAWAAFDDGKDDPAAIYVVTDSRITWGNKSTWDCAQKVFCATHSKEIFGYCGDVMCVTQTLSQIVQLANLGAFNSSWNTREKAHLYASLIRDALITYPKEQIVSNSSLIYVQRLNKTYDVYEIKIPKNLDISVEKISLTKSLPGSKIAERTDRIVRGSGASTFKEKLESDTTYQAFHRFCECIDDEGLSDVGGVPQAVTIRRNGDCLILGINTNGKNRALGLSVNFPEQFPGIKEWKNENFERWNANENKLIPGAKRQPKANSTPGNPKLP